MCDSLKGVSASSPLATAMDTRDTIDTTSNLTARVKEAEVESSVTFALNLAQPLTRPIVVPTVQIRYTGGVVCHRAALYTLCQRDSSRQVCRPFPSHPCSDVIFQICDCERFVFLGYGGNDAERRAEWAEWRSSHGRDGTRRRPKPWKGQGERRRCSVRSILDLPRGNHQCMGAEL